MMIGRQRQGQDRSARRGSARRWSLLGSTALACALAGVLAVAAFATPVDRTLPFVEGNVKEGGRVFCETGTWSGVAKFTFVWVVEGEVITSPSEYPGLTLEKAYQGHELENRQIWCIVAGSNNSGTEKAEEESSNSICFGPSCGNNGPPPEAPVPQQPFPVVSGKGERGARLECSSGTWGGHPTPALTYSWRRNGIEIPSQTGASYEVESADEGDTLTCRVTGKNYLGEAFEESSNSVSVKGKPPKL